jgi:integrase
MTAGHWACRGRCGFLRAVEGPGPKSERCHDEGGGCHGADEHPARYTGDQPGGQQGHGADRGDVEPGDLHATAHVLRRTFATTLVRGGTDLVVVADMLGHASLDQIRRYSLPTAADRQKAPRLLPVDR